MAWVRRMYDWVLHWAETPYGTPALIGISFAESSFFPIPPDPLLMALAIGNRNKSLLYALYCTLASVAGGILGYYIGVFFIDQIGLPLIEFYGKVEAFETLKTKFQDTTFILVISAALTPIPYKVFTIAAGAASADLPTFIVASLVGRGFRFGTEGALIYFFGAPIRTFIDKYFEKLAILFTVLLILGFILIKYLM
jgi:membrane protein YqaA with SNARE-associated domain